MGARSERLARDLEEQVAELMKTVRSCADSGWGAVCEGEGWTVAQTAHHLAGGFSIEMEYVVPAAEGRPLPT